MISRQSCAEAPSAGGMNWMKMLCRAAVLTRFTKNAHPARTHRALKTGCNVAKGPMELHFIHVALGTSGSCISCFVLHALSRCQEPKLITWECQYSTFLQWLTRIERVSGNKIDSLQVPTFNVSIVFHTLWEDAGWHNWIPASAPFNVYTVFTLSEYTR